MITYSKDKALKLREEYNYLFGRNYFPEGKAGHEFRITDINADLNRHIPEGYSMKILRKETEPEDFSIKIDSENNWRVILTMENESETMFVELEEVLKVLKIRHHIHKLNFSPHQTMNIPF